ncbi:Hypothetical protein SMAX5B_011258, partial [Scophthalmus maximus]
MEGEERVSNNDGCVLSAMFESSMMDGREPLIIPSAVLTITITMAGSFSKPDGDAALRICG